MTKRCRHEYETKPGYPDELLCQKCQSCWTITDYLDWDAKRLMTIPKRCSFCGGKKASGAN